MNNKITLVLLVIAAMVGCILLVDYGVNRFTQERRSLRVGKGGIVVTRPNETLEEYDARQP